MAKEIGEEYASSLADLTVNSKPLINMLTILAEENIVHAGVIVETVEKHLEKVPSDIKLPVLYLVDSIIKNVGGAYTQKFAQSIVSMFTKTFKVVDEKTRSQMFKLRDTWHDVFPTTKLYQLDVKVNLIDPAWPIQAQPQPQQAKIHFNPNFLKKPATTSPVVPITKSVSDEDEKMRLVLAQKEKELMMLQQKKIEMEMELKRQMLAAEKSAVKPVIPGVSIPVPAVSALPTTDPVSPARQRVVTSKTTGGSRIAPVSGAMLSAVRDPRLAARMQQSAPTQPIAPNVFDIKPLERTAKIVKRKNVLTIDVTAENQTRRENGSRDPRTRREPRNRNFEKRTETKERFKNRQDKRKVDDRKKETDKANNRQYDDVETSKNLFQVENSDFQSKATRSPIEDVIPNFPTTDQKKINKLPPIPKLNRRQDDKTNHIKSDDLAPSPSKRKKESQSRSEKKSSKKQESGKEGSDSSSSPEKRGRGKSNKIKNKEAELFERPEDDSVPFKELKNYNKERYMRRNKEKSESPDISVPTEPSEKETVPVIISAEATNIPDVVVENMDVDLRRLLPEPAPIAQKRPSTETIEPKTSKKHKLDKLFGTEDVDLRQLPQVEEASKPTEVEDPSETPTSLETSPKKDWAEFREKNTLHSSSNNNPELAAVRAKLAEATKGKDRLGRKLRFSGSYEDTDFRTNSKPEDLDTESDKQTIKMIMSQAEENFKSGTMDKEQYNTLMFQVMQIHEKLKLKEAKQRESLEESKRKLHNVLPNEGDNENVKPLNNDNNFGDIDERITPIAYIPKDSDLHKELPVGDSDLRVNNHLRPPLNLIPPLDMGPPSDILPPPDRRHPSDIRHPHDIRHPQDMRYPQDVRHPQDMLHPSDMIHPSDMTHPSDLRHPQDMRFSSNMRYSQDRRHSADIRHPSDMRHPSDRRQPMGPMPDVLPRPPLPPMIPEPPFLQSKWRGSRMRTEEFNGPRSRLRGPMPPYPRGNFKERLPLLPVPLPIPSIGLYQGESPLAPYDRVDSPPPLGTPGIHILPADYKIIEYIDQDPMKTIEIDGISREIRFYDDTAIVMLDWETPKEIKFFPGSRRITFDNKDSLVLVFNEDYIKAEVDDQVFDIKFGAPTRELYINQRWHECYFGGPPAGIMIDGVPRVIQLEGPPPQVDIGTEKRTDLVAGKINMIIDATHMFPVFLDAKPQKFTLDNVMHTIRFVDALRTVLINEYPFKVEFGGLPKPIFFGNRKHFIRFSVLPKWVKPGQVKIAKMEGRSELPPPPVNPVLPLLHSDENADIPDIKPINTEVKTETTPMEVDNKELPLCERVLTSPGIGDKEDSSQGLDMLASVMPTSMAPMSQFSRYSLGSSTNQIPGLDTPIEEKPQPGSNIGLPFLSNINVNDLFEKLLATGIVPKMKEEGNEKKVEADVKPPIKNDVKEVTEDKNTVKVVNLLKPETLRVKQPGIISRLYGGMQCCSCGARFPPEHTVRYSHHLDWHFRQNRRERDSARRAHSRRWHYDLPDWVQYEEVEDLDEREKSYFETNPPEGPSEVPSEVPEREAPSVPAGAPVQQYCALCGDKFDQFYNEDKEEWHLRKAVSHEDKNYHPLCFEDFKASQTKADTKEGEESELLEEDSSVVTEEASVILVERADSPDTLIEIKDDTRSQSDTESVVEVLDEDRMESEPVEIDEEEDGDEDDVVLKTEPVEQLEVGDDDTDDETHQERTRRDLQAAIDLAHLKVKQEPVDPDDEPVITAEEQAMQAPADTTSHIVTSSIDGNLQLTTRTPADLPSIRINISTLPQRPPTTTNIPTGGSPVEDDEPLPPGEEIELEYTKKPTLEGVELIKKPPVQKGSELSGLCSIM